MKRRKYDMKNYYETIICDCGKEIKPFHQTWSDNPYVYDCPNCNRQIEVITPLGFNSRIFEESYAEVEE